MLMIFLFQFPPLCEGRLMGLLLILVSLLFQFPPLCEGRLLDLIQPPAPHNFNSRPCVRGDSRSTASHTGILCYFNSRPCVRGDPRRVV